MIVFLDSREEDVFQFAEAAELVLPEMEDLRLFRKYYKRCIHCADPTVPPRPPRVAACPPKALPRDAAC